MLNTFKEFYKASSRIRFAFINYLVSIKNEPNEIKFWLVLRRNL